MRNKDKIEKKTQFENAMKALENYGCDVTFVYNNIGCSICSVDDFYALGYDGNSIEIYSFDEVKNTKVFNGKSLNEIYAEVEFYY